MILNFISIKACIFVSPINDSLYKKEGNIDDNDS